MDVLRRVTGEREKNRALHREGTNIEIGCRVVRAVGRHSTPDRSQENRTWKRSEVRWTLFLFVALRCEYLSFEFLTRGYISLAVILLPFPCTLPKTQLMCYQKSLVRVSVWSCEQQLGWEVERGAFSGPFWGAGELSVQRVLCQCYLGQAWWHKSNTAWRRLQMGKWWYYSWIHEKQLPGAAKDPKKQCHKKVRSLLALLSMPGFQIWRVD